MDRILSKLADIARLAGAKSSPMSLLAPGARPHPSSRVSDEYRSAEQAYGRLAEVLKQSKSASASASASFSSLRNRILALQLFARLLELSGSRKGPGTVNKNLKNQGLQASMTGTGTATAPATGAAGFVMDAYHMLLETTRLQIGFWETVRDRIQLPMDGAIDAMFSLYPFHDASKSVFPITREFAKGFSRSANMGATESPTATATGSGQFKTPWGRLSVESYQAAMSTFLKVASAKLEFVRSVVPPIDTAFLMRIHAMYKLHSFDAGCRDCVPEYTALADETHVPFIEECFDAWWPVALRIPVLREWLVFHVQREAETSPAQLENLLRLYASDAWWAREGGDASQAPMHLYSSAEPDDVWDALVIQHIASSEGGRRMLDAACLWIQFCMLRAHTSRQSRLLLCKQWNVPYATVMFSPLLPPLLAGILASDPFPPIVTLIQACFIGIPCKMSVRREILAGILVFQHHLRVMQRLSSASPLPSSSTATATQS
eukprot:ANDGO_01482.mRNA.1 hypothetical protein